MGAQLPDRVRQVPYHAARQSGDRRSAPGRILPQGLPDERTGQGKALAVAYAVGEPERSEPALRDEPEAVQGLPAQREPRPALELPLRSCHGALSQELDRATEMATASTVRETRGDADPAYRRNPELLPDEGAAGCSRSCKRQHQVINATRARLQKPALPAAEGSEDGCRKNRIRRLHQSGVK